MREYGSNINLPSLDNLFSSEQERQDAKLEKIQILPLTELHPFRNHPFQVRDDDEMDKMVDSVKEYGVMTPAIVRPRKDGGYEIVAGHRRCHASQRAGVETMPCIVRDMDDDTAIILMVDSNCQREHILPSEKAKAYEMKLEAIRRKAGRPSKENSRQVVGDFESADLVGQASGESGRQVQRFIRLNKLTPELMKMVDDGKLKTTPAVELSYLTPEEQEDFLSYMESEGCTPSLSQAQKLKEASKESVLTPEKIQHIMAAKPPSVKPRDPQLMIPVAKVERYFPKGFTSDQMQQVNYTQNNDKTEHQLYVSGFNCIPQNAYEIMMETKTRWRKPVKDGNILAYHIIQSFAPGEATPDQVHQIGCEFVQRFLADRFECTVSTHLDRGHLHNHIVVNSVSYADGRMFRSDFNTYYKGIRKTSDELCRENRLSVIETDGKGKSYDEWLSGQAGKPTIRGMVRKDVEQAIAAADSFDGFITELQNMGYTVKYGPRVEHMAVRHKDAQRNIRIDRFDPRFSETALREYYRQLHHMPTEMQQEYRQENAPAKPKWQPTELQPTVRRARYLGKLPRRYPKVSGFMACYYHYCALLRKAYHGKSTKRCYFLLREDFLLFSRYQQQTKFLWENHIETMDELLAYKENAEAQIQQLARQRKVLYRQKREPERAARDEKIKSLTQQMKALRHEVYICSDIETDAAEVQEKLRQAELAAQEERNEVKQYEQRRRSSRSDGAGSLTGYRSSH